MRPPCIQHVACANGGWMFSSRLHSTSHLQFRRLLTPKPKNYFFFFLAFFFTFFVFFATMLLLC